MMIEDRFRVRGWDMYEKKYFENIQNMLYGEENAMTLLSAIEKDLVKTLIPEQCTGLKDKNGKLIYEGDILSDEDSSFEQIYKVKLIQECAEFLLNGVNTTGSSFNAIPASSLKVIGNIHEDEILLENQ